MANEQPTLQSSDPIWSVPIDLAAITALGNGCMPGALGIEFTDFGPDWLCARMPVAPIVHQPFGRLHGGASVVLAETVASIATAMTLDLTKQSAVGMEINANHIRAARDGYVYATARSEHRGRTSQVWTTRIVDDSGRLVCVSRITMAVIPLEQG